MKKAFNIDSPYGWVHIYYDKSDLWYAIKKETGEISKPYASRASLLKLLTEKEIDWSNFE